MLRLPSGAHGRGIRAALPDTTSVTAASVVPAASSSQFHMHFKSCGASCIRRRSRTRENSRKLAREQDHCSSMLLSHRGARRSYFSTSLEINPCSSMLLSHVQRRSKSLFEHASELQRRSKSLFRHASELQTLKIAAPATLLSSKKLFEEAVLCKAVLCVT